MSSKIVCLLYPIRVIYPESIRHDITINADKSQCRIMGKEIDESSQATKAYQLQTISNLHNPGIPNEIISLQLDITEKEVEKTRKN